MEKELFTSFLDMEEAHGSVLDIKFDHCGV